MTGDGEIVRSEGEEREKKIHSNGRELVGQINAAPGTSVYQDRD